MHVTDPHLFADPEGNLRGTNTRASLQSVLDDIAREAWPADLVALTGDLVQDDSRDAYKRVASMLESLHLPVHCVPGNHDVRELMREQLRPPRFQYCTANTYANWLIVGIDSCLSGQAGGAVDAAELRRLKKILSDTDAEHALVCLHHPPLPVGSRWLDTVGLENGAEFLELLAVCGNVRTAIFGHVHQAFDRVHSGIRIVGTPSTCRQFAIMSDEFALDDNPPAYRRLELWRDGSVKTQLIWIDN